jgi:hypothetical protein
MRTISFLSPLFLSEPGTHGTAPGKCGFCGQGTYQDAKGQIECKGCPQDTYSNKNAAKARADCVRLVSF